MRVETKKVFRDNLLDDLGELIKNRNFCSEMYEETGRYKYLELIEIINAKISKRKRQLGELVYGQISLD